MNLEQLLTAAVHRGDLITVDSHFTQIGINDVGGMINLKVALVALANVADFELSLRPTYKLEPEPCGIIKPLKQNLAFAKYLRNKAIGHIHPELVAKAVEWQPMLRKIPCDIDDPQLILQVNLWLLETAINTYVNDDGGHKVFDGDTDLMYPPDWARFVNSLR